MVPPLRDIAVRFAFCVGRRGPGRVPGGCRFIYLLFIQFGARRLRLVYSRTINKDSKTDMRKQVRKPDMEIPHRTAACPNPSVLSYTKIRS